MHLPDRSLIEHRLRVALALRERLYTVPYYRVVFGESDGLPGLVLDRYGDTIVGQIATAGMEALRPEVEAPWSACWARVPWCGRTTAARASWRILPRQVLTPIGKAPEELKILENGLSFSVPLASAQKTGWFYDQSLNREQWRRMLSPGARVLDACSYAGAWAVSALTQGAREALCVDASEGALSIAMRSAAANGVASARNAATSSRCSTNSCDAVSASMRSCSTHRRSSNARKTYRVGRPPTASSTRSRCVYWSAMRCW
jgi:23S rRNA (cytosine1962-C5)-methyltransferase